MLQFEQIKEETMDDIKIEPIGDKEVALPKSFILIYTDDELIEEAIPEVWDKLSEHDFDADAENIDFIVYFDDLINKSKIIMALYYSENDSNIPEINKIADYYCPLFEDFYSKIKPY
ncbi:hypothetical protein [Methanobacterium sp. ACI-7]|uniref:hypothetical protein n=1 Tax=unclassified Methanobacterium TaxID=2627676 RepID=UPI0039C2E6FC